MRYSSNALRLFADVFLEMRPPRTVGFPSVITSELNFVLFATADFYFSSFLLCSPYLIHLPRTSLSITPPIFVSRRETLSTTKERSLTFKIARAMLHSTNILFKCKTSTFVCYLLSILQDCSVGVTWSVHYSPTTRSCSLECFSYTEHINFFSVSTFRCKRLEWDWKMSVTCSLCIWIDLRFSEQIHIENHCIGT